MPQKRRNTKIPKSTKMEYLFAKSRVSSKGWVVIPKAIRDAMGIGPGDEISFALFPPSLGMKQDMRLSTLRLSKTAKTRAEVMEMTNGMFQKRPGEEAWTKGLLRDRREELEREERDLPRPRSRRRKTA